MHRFLIWLSGWLRVRFIDVDGEPYLERYRVFELFGVGCYLHRFMSEDPDRGLHDHPWRWALAVPLCGGYIEERLDYLDGYHGTVTRTATRRWPYLITSRYFHRVTAINNPCWTLFIHGRRFKVWGFLREHPFEQIDYLRGEAVGIARLDYRQDLDVERADDFPKDAPRARDVRIGDRRIRAATGLTKGVKQA